MIRAIQVIYASLLAIGVLAVPARAATLEVTVDAGMHDRRHTPIRVDVDVPRELTGPVTVTLTDPSGRQIPGQIERRGLLASAPEAGRSERELQFILDELAAGDRVTLAAAIDPGSSGRSGRFIWHASLDVYAELRYLSPDLAEPRPVLRYMYAPLDESLPESREQTYKVYHHLFDPSGAELVTKGPGGLYTHHRGLFYGFNKVNYGDGKTADVWHCRGKAYQSHEGFLSAEAGPVFGRHRLVIDWHGQDGEVIAREQRELTAFHVPGGQLVEFASKLNSTVGMMELRGDPQHAGLHFRASNEVADRTNTQTYYLRPDGPGSPGETRNWPDVADHINLPFDAMSFVLGDQRYTAAYLDRDENPKEARFSERDYGRFGSYFEYDLAADAALEVNYRLWLQQGEITVDDVARMRADFADPPAVTVTWK